MLNLLEAPNRPDRRQVAAVWLGWVFANATGGVIGSTFFGPIVLLMTAIGADPWVTSNGASIIAGIAGLGFAQWLFLRRYFPAIRFWGLASVVCGVAGTLASWVVASAVWYATY